MPPDPARPLCPLCRPPRRVPKLHPFIEPHTGRLVRVCARDRRRLEAVGMGLAVEWRAKKKAS